MIGSLILAALITLSDGGRVAQYETHTLGIVSRDGDRMVHRRSYSFLHLEAELEGVEKVGSWEGEGRLIRFYSINYCTGLN